MCIVEFKKIKNYKLVIRVAASSSNNSIRKHFLWRFDPQYLDFLGREPVAGNHKILSKDHVDSSAIFSEWNAQIISAAQRPSS